MLPRIRRAILAAAAAAWVVAMVLQGVVDNTYVNYPRTPNPEINRTVPHEVKRVIGYTRDQRLFLTG